MNARQTTRRNYIVALAAATSLSLLAPGAAFAQSVTAVPGAPVITTIPGGTPVAVHLTSLLSSSNAQEGDHFSFAVAEDVRVGGWLVIPAGAEGVGEIASQEGAGGNGHGGNLQLQFDYVYAADGEKIRLTPTVARTEGSHAKGAASTMTFISYALVGPLGLFAHNLIKGRDATISPKQVFTVFVDRTVHVAASDFAKTDDYAH